jgi:hypothetical protein
MALGCGTAAIAGLLILLAPSTWPFPLTLENRLWIPGVTNPYSSLLRDISFLCTGILALIMLILAWRRELDRVKPLGLLISSSIILLVFYSHRIAVFAADGVFPVEFFSVIAVSISEVSLPFLVGASAALAAFPANRHSCWAARTGGIILMAACLAAYSMWIIAYAIYGHSAIGKLFYAPGFAGPALALVSILILVMTLWVSFKSIRNWHLHPLATAWARRIVIIGLALFVLWDVYFVLLRLADVPAPLIGPLDHGGLSVIAIGRMLVEDVPLLAFAIAVYEVLHLRAQESSGSPVAKSD